MILGKDYTKLYSTSDNMILGKDYTKLYSTSNNMILGKDLTKLYSNSLHDTADQNRAPGDQGPAHLRQHDPR